MRSASLYARGLLLSAPNRNPNPSPSLSLFAASGRSRLGLFSSDPDSSNGSNFTQTQREGSSIDVEDVSDQELKRRIEKFYAGDVEAVPLIFEAILKRKLAGKHDDADNKLMEEICGKREEPLDITDDEELHSDEDLDSDFEGSSYESEEDFDELCDVKKDDMKKRGREE